MFGVFIFFAGLDEVSHKWNVSRLIIALIGHELPGLGVEIPAHDARFNFNTIQSIAAINNI